MGDATAEEKQRQPVKRRRGAARGRILDAAARRFYADGVAATGIDTITAEAGVAKMSLYNNFDSKADLVCAYLQARHEEWLDLYRRRLAEAQGPAAGVLAVFDAYADHADFAYEHGFRGCGLLNAAAELPTGHEGRTVVRRHKEQVEGLLAAHLRELLPGRDEQARSVAEHLAFLLEGAIVRAGLEGDGTRMRHARDLAASLLGTL
ncbi:TetR/AcrR family transcriptional regulator [Streptomyces sp. NBC_00257]|uniref:TetR/AcrR family transcriptional regulator n=1 Tax=Streptomyces TaxID=1883 RepID=UPI0022533141|nr:MULTISPECIES: TetR/AcrR family transcriptional regulator [unclassified Streptomyces]WSW07230.1 TetR/AcrR family transcriptional regulator [Streptomyces sp. NBC_01005]WTB54925.1 TetR/AcrR family transcriptional regulator [Streptomyces sp. NBC_00826]WTC96739.1 TetR/AcrR family transcriptional regulator [Streptomyces sp. NBC_01650]WTH92189.1 TetR/AcrR family transcriptional regulator [Streptomyces sp. NBC_00825]WTI00918.1 TetR/AcrR family transcriptional regulator [Streptomyces sp. NBC_00822]